jgi:hypothetical protein
MANPMCVVKFLGFKAHTNFWNFRKHVDNLHHRRHHLQSKQTKANSTPPGPALLDQECDILEVLDMMWSADLPNVDPDEDSNVYSDGVWEAYYQCTIEHFLKFLLPKHK